MTAPHTISASCPDDALSAAVAEHCAGWTRHTSNLGNAAEPFWTLGREYRHSWQFAYAESVDACLPLLGDSFEIASIGDGFRAAVFPSGAVYRANAPTVARAICLAMLKSKGFEVTP